MRLFVALPTHAPEERTCALPLFIREPTDALEGHRSVLPRLFGRLIVMVRLRKQYRNSKRAYNVIPTEDACWR